MPNVSPLEIYANMPSGLSYNQRELVAAERWWVKMAHSARWWMAIQVYPTNLIQYRVRAAVGPLKAGTESVDFAIIAYGSTEIEAKIHVMRQVTQITNK